MALGVMALNIVRLRAAGRMMVVLEFGWLSVSVKEEKDCINLQGSNDEEDTFEHRLSISCTEFLNFGQPRVPLVLRQDTLKFRRQWDSLRLSADDLITKVMSDDDGMLDKQKFLQ